MSLYKGAKKIAGLIRGEDISHATETHAGVIEIANQGEVLGGASDSKAVTPTKLKQYYYGKVEINDLLNAKQDIIDDLDTIRSGAGLGATSIQSVKTINGEDITGTGDITIGGASSFSDLTGQPSDNANLKTALDSKATTSELNAHTTNGVIHVTGTDKTNWNGKTSIIIRRW